ncbi:Uncharacterised protein [Bacillus freudenreichii]|nr:Uncharacterised protein [Bacillus freudenreichii]
MLVDRRWSWTQHNPINKLSDMEFYSKLNNNDKRAILFRKSFLQTLRIALFTLFIVFL